jgi:hypothetical protein
MGAAAPAPKAPQGPLITITPQTGGASQFELVRVQEDLVEVRREGVRLSFSRSQIKQIRCPEAESMVREASQTLSAVEAEKLDTFESLLPRIEEELPQIRQISERYGWLVPQSAKLAEGLEQASQDIHATLDAWKLHAAAAAHIEKMAEGAIPLDASWETVVDSALEQTKQIPFSSIRKEAGDRLLTLRRKIRLDLAKATEDAADKAKSLLDELHGGLEKGNLSEARVSLLLNEAKRVSSKIADIPRRNDMEDAIREGERLAHVRLAEIGQARVRTRAEAALGALRKTVEEASASLSNEQFAQRLAEARNLAGQVASASAKADLLDSIQETSKRREQALAVAVRSATPVAAAPRTTPPSPKASDLVSRLIGPLKSAFGDGWFLYAAGVLLLIIPKRWIVRGGKAKKAKTEKKEGKEEKPAGPIPAFPGYAPTPSSAQSAEDSDLFGLPSSSLAAAEGGIAAPGIAAPAIQKGEDVFGFGDQPPEPSVQTPPTPAEDLLSVSAREDPFAEGGEDFSVGGETPSVTAQEPEPPTDQAIPQIQPAPADGDPFGFGEAVPPKAAELEPPIDSFVPPKTPAKEDPFAFGESADEVLSQYESPAQDQPELSGPADAETASTSSSIEEEALPGKLDISHPKSAAEEDALGPVDAPIPVEGIDLPTPSDTLLDLEASDAELEDDPFGFLIDGKDAEAKGKPPSTSPPPQQAPAQPLQESDDDDPFGFIESPTTRKG